MTIQEAGHIATEFPKTAAWGLWCEGKDTAEIALVFGPGVSEAFIAGQIARYLDAKYMLRNRRAA